jgi:hypothetical protein
MVCGQELEHILICIQAPIHMIHPTEESTSLICWDRIQLSGIRLPEDDLDLTETILVMTIVAIGLPLDGIIVLTLLQ